MEDQITANDNLFHFKQEQENKIERDKPAVFKLKFFRPVTKPFSISFEGVPCTAVANNAKKTKSTTPLEAEIRFRLEFKMFAGGRALDLNNPCGHTDRHINPPLQVRTNEKELSFAPASEVEIILNFGCSPPLHNTTEFQLSVHMMRVVPEEDYGIVITKPTYRRNPSTLSKMKASTERSKDEESEDIPIPEKKRKYIEKAIFLCSYLREADRSEEYQARIDKLESSIKDFKKTKTTVDVDEFLV